MKIQGFQKLTLLDYPEKTASTIFTAGCNFLCPFCHNGDLVLKTSENVDIPEEEVLSVLKKRVGFIDGVCITGGEPTLQNDLPDFIKKVKSLGLLVKLDTNGALPDKLKSLIGEGLVDYVAMDIKNSKKSYPKTVGIENFDVSRVERSVEMLKTSGIDHEFRTTVTKELHSLSDIEEIGKWLSGDDKYFLQPYRESEGVIDKSLSSPDKETLFEMLDIARKYLPNASLRGIE